MGFRDGKCETSLCYFGVNADVQSYRQGSLWEMQCNDTSLILNILLRNFFCLFLLCALCSLNPRVLCYFSIKMHNRLWLEHASMESLGSVVSQWTLSCSSKPLCISIAISITKLCSWGGCPASAAQSRLFLLPVLYSSACPKRVGKLASLP